MNASQIWEVLTRALGQSDVVQKLGWMLLHSIWQGAAGACILWIFLLATRSLRDRIWSSIRYTAACMALLAVILASAITFARSMRPSPAVVRISPVFPIISLPDNFHSFSHPETIRVPPAKFDPHSLIPITVYLWFIGVAIQSIWQCAGWIRLRRLRRGVAIADPVWVDILQETSARLGIRRMVGLVVGAIDVPAVIGAFRPVIIIPLALVNELSPQQVQAILAHELAHIRRWDYAVNLIQTAVETLFFYHPAVWWISAQIRRERENCCDDIAANLCGDPRRYAGTLIKLEERRADSPRLSLAATDGSLIDRIRRLLAVPTPRTGRARSILVALVGLICVLVPIGWQRTSRAQATQPVAQIPSTRPTNARREDSDRPIAVGDVIIVSMKDLNGEGTGEQLTNIDGVDAKGDLKLPRIGFVHALGLTKEELVAEIEKTFQDAKFDPIPQVKIVVDSHVAGQPDPEVLRLEQEMRDAAQAQVAQTPAAIVPQDVSQRVIAAHALILVGMKDPNNESAGEHLAEIDGLHDQGDLKLQRIAPVHALGMTQEQLVAAIDKGYRDTKIDPVPQFTIVVETHVPGQPDPEVLRLLQQVRDAAKAASTTQASGSTLSQDDLNLANQLQGNDPELRQMLSDRRHLIDQLLLLKADGYGDRHATVMATRQNLADTEQRLKTYLADARANPPTKPSYQYVHVTIGKSGFISVDGGVGNWDTLREGLLKESEAERAKVVIVLAAETTDLPVGDFFLAQAMATEMVKELGLAYVSVAGVETYSGVAATRPDSVVYIGGHAKRAGVYSIANSHMTISQLVIAAGGVDGGDDSHAWVTLIRRIGGEKKEVLKDVPLFDIESGTSDQYLQPDDTVEISVTEPPAATEPTGGVYYIGGHVLRAGVYSFVGQRRTLRQAIDDAGGVSADAPKDPWLEVIRRVDGVKEVFVKERLADIRKGGTFDLDIQADDTLEIGTNEAASTDPAKPTVKIQGNVRQPGEYRLEPNESVGDLIRYARGVRDMDANGVNVLLFRNQTALALPPINEILSLPHGEILLEPDDMLIVTDPPKSSNENAPTKSGGLASGPTTAPSFNKSVRGSVFFFFGKFDLAQTGQSTAIDKPKLEELVITSGGKVQTMIGADTDCVVLGAAPNLEPIPWEDRQDPIQLKRQHDAWGERIAYGDVLNTANLLHIPVMNQNQFLALVK